MRIGGVKTVISADIMKTKVPNFPWPERTLDLRKEIEAMGGKKAILPWLIAAWVLPNQLIPAMLGLPTVGDLSEAGLLFTSGSSGEPKGVALSHRNILANCAQVSSLSILPERCSLLGCLPVFHSFGFTITLWYPLIRGCRVVTVPSPLDTRKIIDAIHEESATVLIGAPTFVRPILRKAKPGELRSMELVVTGAEKLPDDLYEAFMKQFHLEIMQGYGLTETTPASNINQPHPPITTFTAEPQVGKKAGSVGRLLPGMTARIVHPETGEEVPAGEAGIVWFRGANVFSGYLDDAEKTQAAFQDGWFVTGDLGRLDEEGFLLIEGRLSRFSKIGGEMVPHGTIEQRIGELFELYDELYFGSLLCQCVDRDQLSFRLSRRMTRAGGKTTRWTYANRPGVARYEIAVSTPLLFQSFNDPEHKVKVTGLECDSRLDGLMRVMEHELVHLIEMLVWSDSSCAMHRFQNIASRFFGHTDHRHELMTPRDAAVVNYVIKTGSRVRFDYEGNKLEGIVNRVTKRATVLVAHPQGERYSDGVRYVKFYIPVSALEPIS